MVDRLLCLQPAIAGASGGLRLAELIAALSHALRELVSGGSCCQHTWSYTESICAFVYCTPCGSV